jgi:uncharacterized membrane protein YdjX (TVP38/TMEM64 family)
MRRLLAFGVFAASFALAAFVLAEKHTIDRLLAAAGPATIPIAVLIFAIVAIAPFSVTDALAVSNGALFGPWLGSAVNAAGLLLAALGGYALALRTSKLLNLEEELARLPAWSKRFAPGSAAFLIVVRAIPGIGGTVATQAAASLRVPLLRHVYTMCIVTVPLCTALAFGGGAISQFVGRLLR